MDNQPPDVLNNCAVGYRKILVHFFIIYTAAAAFVH